MDWCTRVSYSVSFGANVKNLLFDKNEGDRERSCDGEILRLRSE